MNWDFWKEIFLAVLEKFANERLLIVLLLCFVFSLLAYLFFRKSSEKVKFAAFVLISVFFGAAITVTSGYLKDAEFGSGDAAYVEAPREEIRIAASAYKYGRNVAVGPLPNLYGESVLMNGPPFEEVPNMAAFEVVTKTAGSYVLFVRLASAEKRPIALSVNDVSLGSPVLDVVSGGWLPSDQEWFEATVVRLESGVNLVEFSRAGVFPHITSIKFVLVEE